MRDATTSLFLSEDGKKKNYTTLTSNTRDIIVSVVHPAMNMVCAVNSMKKGNILLVIGCPDLNFKVFFTCYTGEYRQL